MPNHLNRTIRRSRFGRSMRKKTNSVSSQLQERLRRHRQGHISDGNPMDMVNKHMKVMRDLIKKGSTFSGSHIVAQKEYPMRRG